MILSTIFGKMIGTTKGLINHRHGHRKLGDSIKNQ